MTRKKRDEPVFYIMTHEHTGAYYVGSTKDFPNRKSQHLHLLRKGRHPCNPLQRLYDRHPEANTFKWTVTITSTREQAYALEQQLLTDNWGDVLLMNGTNTAVSPITGVLVDPEVEKRRVAGLQKVSQTAAYAKTMSEAGLKAWSVEGRREARSGAGNPFAKGVIIDEVTYGSVKDAVKATNISEKTIRKRANLPDYPNYRWA